jgi:hypothetical protein
VENSKEPIGILRAKLGETLALADRFSLTIVGVWISSAIDALSTADEAAPQLGSGNGPQA